MNRTARVVMQNNHCVTLELQRQAKCAGCPSHCNEPLFKLFSMKTKNIRVISGGQTVRHSIVSPQLNSDQFSNKNKLLPEY